MSAPLDQDDPTSTSATDRPDHPSENGNTPSLVSWNFKHIVRLEKICLFNEVNVQLGYKALNILSPREVTTYEGS
jgi:hypothetical protein